MTEMAEPVYCYQKDRGWVPGGYETACRVVLDQKIIVVRKPPKIGDNYYCIKPDRGDNLNTVLDNLEWQIKRGRDYVVGGLYTQSVMNDETYQAYELVTFWLENV